MVSQAYQLFGSRHYQHYDLLVWLSDELGPAYYEHQQSGENAVPANVLKVWNDSPGYRSYFAHGFVHSWNGMFRRPAQMWTPNLNTPERDDLLWVFEGLTCYWADVLATRAGLWTRQDALDAFDELAATMSTDIGAEWRPLQDVSNDPIILGRKDQTWPSWQRNMFDSYSQGELIWLDVDTLIRQRSGGSKSLDDFARGFFGIHDGSAIAAPYTFEDLVAGLNAVMPYDWKTFLRSHLVENGPGGRLDGLTRGGYELIYSDQPTAAQTSREAKRAAPDLRF
jgi:predicted metalloprotease with PDZ domain